MMKFVKVALYVLVIWTASVTLSYAQNGTALTLDECIDIALKSNSQFKIAAYQVDRAGANVTSSYSNILPRISATLQSGRIITDRSNYDPRVGEIVNASRNFHSFGMNFGITLFDFGGNWNSIREAKAAFDARSQNLASARQNVYADVKQRYMELLKAVALEREFREAVLRSKEQLNRTQSMYEIGSVAQIDVYRQDVILGNDEANLINQINIVKIARANLNVTMGREPDIPLEIMEIEPTPTPIQFNLAEAYTIAEKNSPTLREFEYDMKSAEHGRKRAKANFWPSFGIGGSYSNTGQVPSEAYGSFDKSYQLSVGLQMTFPIFNGFTDKAEISRQSANYSIANENWHSTRRQTYLEVKQAYLNLQAFSEIAKINERSLKSAEEDYRLAQERYRVGAGTQLEVTDAQVSLTRARVNLVRSKYDAMIAQAQLEAAMGTIEEN